MIWIPSGSFEMGSNNHYPEEKPAAKTSVEGFWIDPCPVTNSEFQEFTETTGYVSVAETPPDKDAYPEVPEENLKAGSAVFVQPEGPVDLLNPYEWWGFIPEASWRHPRGPGSDTTGLENHPVVHIAYPDALAYAEWAEKELPTEAEWEYAARGGIEAAEFSWGNELEPNGKTMANIWKGLFPEQNLKKHAPGTTPVAAYEPNGYGIFDMCGNVWEWTTDTWGQRTGRKSGEEETDISDLRSPCCAPPGPPPKSSGSYQPPQVQTEANRHKNLVIKGGSFLCSQNYCSRYRPAARIPETADTSTSHLGFRCVRRQSDPS